MTTFSALSEELTQQIFFHLPFNDALSLRCVEHKTNRVLKATLTTIVGPQPHAKEGVFYSYLLSKYGLSEEDVEQLRSFLAGAGIELKSGRETIGYLRGQSLPKGHLAKIKKRIQATCLKYDEVTVEFCRQLRSSLIKLRRYDILRAMVDTRENQGISDEELSDESVLFKMLTPSKNPIFTALAKGEKREVIIKKIKASDQKTLNEVSLGRSLVHIAVLNNDIEMLSELLKKGVCVNRKSAMGQNPLNEALNCAVLPFPGIVDVRKEIVTLLVHYGAEIDTRNYTGGTPLGWAAQTGNLKIVLLLLSLGADPNFKDGGGMTATRVAIASGHQEVARAMVSFMKGKRETVGEMYHKAIGGGQQ